MDNKFINAYTAGYIDGDGCFYIGKTFSKNTKTFKFQAILIISSTNNEVLKFFASTYGGTSFLSDLRKKHEGQKPQYQFAIKHQKAVELIDKAMPFLVEKQKQAEIFCEFVKEKCKKTKESLIKTMHGFKHNHDLVKEECKPIIMQNALSKTPSVTDYAYLAGFIDAECCLSIQKYKPLNKPNFCFKIFLACNNTKLPIFKWLLERFGGFIHFIDRKTKNNNHRDQLTWRLSSKALSRLLPNIYQFLLYKKPVCEKLIEFYDTTIPNGGDRHSDEFKRLYAAKLIEREKILDEVHRLNQKGINE